MRYLKNLSIFAVAIFLSITTLAIELPLALRDYDVNIESAKAGTLPITSALPKKPDIGAKDANLQKAIAGLGDYFKSRDFAAFLEAKATEPTKSKKVSFKSVRMLGEGGFGKIFQLQLSYSDKGKTETYDIAVKAPKNDPSSEYLDQYLLEVEINNMRLANHLAHSLPYYGAMMDKSKNIFILTKKLDSSLSQKIAAGGSDEDSFLHHFIMQMSDALNDFGISLLVHNDIKTDNIMIDKDGNFYVIDFGEARRLMPVDMKNIGAVVDKIKGSRGSKVLTYGSDAYKAPEKMIDDERIAKEIDWKKSDTFSMGLTLAALILKKQPNELWQTCAEKIACKLPSVGLTYENFQEMKDYIASLFDSARTGASKIKRAAMKLALAMISVKPSERPSDMKRAYQDFFRAED